MISMRFLDETACAILDPRISTFLKPMSMDNRILGRVGTIVHQEQIDVAGVVDEESLVARGHEVAGFLVRSETDLWDGGEGGMLSVFLFPRSKFLPPLLVAHNNAHDCVRSPPPHEAYISRFCLRMSPH